MTTLFKQFYDLKKEKSSGKEWELLLVKLGGYYESFFEDAKKIAHNMEIKLDYRRDETGGLIEHISIPESEIETAIKTLKVCGYNPIIATEK